jgi:hypothetical protein
MNQDRRLSVDEELGVTNGDCHWFVIKRTKEIDLYGMGDKIR